MTPHSKPSRLHSRAHERNRIISAQPLDLRYPVRVAWPEEPNIAPKGTVLMRYPHGEARVRFTFTVPYVERSAPRMRRIYVVGLWINDEYLIGRDRKLTQTQVQDALDELERRAHVTTT